MPRPKVFRTASAYYHVTARSNNRDWYSLPMDEIWSIYAALLSKTIERYHVVVHAFVLMSNHFHLILRTPEKNISEAMRYFLTEVSREIGRRTGRINHIFGGRYRWSVLWSPRDFAYVYKYVLRNPVRAKICPRVEMYEYSTFGLLLRNRCKIPVVDGIDDFWHLIPRTPAGRARWLNTAPDSEAEQLIRRGLRHYNFTLPNDKSLLPLRLKLAGRYGVETEEAVEAELVLLSEGSEGNQRR